MVNTRKHLDLIDPEFLTSVGVGGTLRPHSLDLLMLSVEVGLEWLIKHCNTEAQGKTVSYRQPKVYSGGSGLSAQSHL